MFEFKDEKQYAYTWLNNGQLPTGEPGELITVEDAIAVPNTSMWLPKVIQNIVKEAVEPMLVGTALLQRIEYHFGQTITFPAVGALDAADIAEGMAYPERQLSMGGATVTAQIGKSGLAVKVTEEMIRYSQFDVINMHLRAAGRALARHKEKKVFNYIRSMGVVCFDNLNPTSSVFGVTTGRGLDGSANGSVIVDNLFDAYSQILLQGFTPNTLLMHPLTWSMFVKDPVMRLMMLNGAGGTFFATHSGSPSGRAPWDASNQGKLGVSGGQNITPGENAGSETATPLTGYPQTLNSAPNLPGYFPFPFRIIVSPFVNFNPATKLTDIMLFDSNELGALIVDEDVATDEWTDPSVDIRKIKLRERYGIGIFNEGMAIGVMRNVKVIPNQVVLPAQATQSVSGDIAAISPTTAVV
ncbi:MAG: phage major capsid protein [Candidatus Thorarchaeota archaeon]|jgi:hypothetical protein